MSLGAQILDASAQPQSAPEQTAQPQEGQSPQQAQGNPSFDLIAKMERQLKQREQEWKSKESKLAEYEAKLKDYEGFDENPLPILMRKGFDMERINKMALETLGDEELDPVARRIKTLEDSLKQNDAVIEKRIKEAIEAKEGEYSKRDQEHKIELFKRDLKSHLVGKKDEYEFVNTHPDGHELVFDVIFEDLQRRSGTEGFDNKPMDYDTAAQKVEAYLDGEASKYLSLNKVKSRFQGDNSDWAKMLKPEEPRTITDSLTTKSAIHPKELSEKERIQAAIDGIKTGKWNVS